MSEHAGPAPHNALHKFIAGDRRMGVLLPFDLEDWTAQWGSLRSSMLKGPAPEFTRDEWAYLIGFLDPHTLTGFFEQTFGADAQGGSLACIYKPRGNVSVWLPNNASLLGPLTLVLISLTGSPIWAKAGSRTDDLAGAFVRYALAKLPPGTLREYLSAHVRIEQFGRSDPRGAEMARWASSRVVFGSDAGVDAVDALPHDPASRLFGFGDHRSEAWVHADRLSDNDVLTLGRVFAIYGRAGCTSPARVVLIDGTPNQCLTIRERLILQWKRIMPRPPAMHHASQNIMNSQLARAQGWDATLAPDNSAVLLTGTVTTPEVPGLWALPIVPATMEACLATLPPNIQTVGHHLSDPHEPGLLSSVTRTHVKRYVPLARMHHFGAIWDGWEFWRELFEVVEIG